MANYSTFNHFTALHHLVWGFSRPKRKLMTTNKQTVAMMQHMQAHGITKPTAALAHALIQLLNSIYKEEKQ